MELSPIVKNMSRRRIDPEEEEEEGRSSSETRRSGKVKKNDVSPSVLSPADSEYNLALQLASPLRLSTRSMRNMSPDRSSAKNDEANENVDESNASPVYTGAMGLWMNALVSSPILLSKESMQGTSSASAPPRKSPPPSPPPTRRKLTFGSLESHHGTEKTSEERDVTAEEEALEEKLEKEAQIRPDLEAELAEVREAAHVMKRRNEEASERVRALESEIQERDAQCSASLRSVEASVEARLAAAHTATLDRIEAKHLKRELSALRRQRLKATEMHRIDVEALESKFRDEVIAAKARGTSATESEARLCESEVAALRALDEQHREAIARMKRSFEERLRGRESEVTALRTLDEQHREKIVRMKRSFEERLRSSESEAARELRSERTRMEQARRNDVRTTESRLTERLTLEARQRSVAEMFAMRTELEASRASLDVMRAECAAEARHRREEVDAMRRFKEMTDEENRSLKSRLFIETQKLDAAERRLVALLTRATARTARNAAEAGRRSESFYVRREVESYPYPWMQEVFTATEKDARSISPTSLPPPIPSDVSSPSNTSPRLGFTSPMKKM
eukprot:g3364.t1